MLKIDQIWTNIRPIQDQLSTRPASASGLEPESRPKSQNSPMQKLIECVPNFSEGRDQNVIRQITDAVQSVDGVSLLDVDPGASTNRTVVTFVGSPETAIEAAFRAIKKASELIDMRKHTGAHPRMGATDVCPLIPGGNVSWEEAIACAHELGKRVGDQLKIPVYLYERAAKNKARSNLSIIRAGEYEGFAEKIKQPQANPDMGPARERSGFGGAQTGKRKTHGGSPAGKPGPRKKGGAGPRARHVEARQSD